jgi:hypothetical protein
LTRPDLIGDLYRRLESAPAQPPPDFEALLKVSVSGGVPLRAEVVTVRRHLQSTTLIFNRLLNR